MLFRAAAVPLKTISSGPYVGTKLMSGLKCNGQENSIIDCDQTTFNNEEWRSRICTSDSDYSGVLCIDCKDVSYLEFLYNFFASFMRKTGPPLKRSIVLVVMKGDCYF